jgi:hypothetical protein
MSVSLHSRRVCNLYIVYRHILYRLENLKLTILACGVQCR